jgi:hypothetical protein
VLLGEGEGGMEKAPVEPPAEQPAAAATMHAHDNSSFIIERIERRFEAEGASPGWQLR